MMRRSLGVFVVLMTAMATAEAGRIYGSLQIDGKAIPTGTEIVINCAGQSYTTKVQKHGRYSINVGKQGTCSFSVAGYAGASTDVDSYAEATRYNFLISRSGNSYRMKRK